MLVHPVFRGKKRSSNAIFSFSECKTGASTCGKSHSQRICGEQKALGSQVLDNACDCSILYFVAGWAWLYLLMNNNPDSGGERNPERPDGGRGEPSNLAADCCLSAQNATAVRDLNRKPEQSGAAVGLDGFEVVTTPKPGETGQLHIKVDGEDRKVFLHLPAGYSPDNPVPLVLVFHGANMKDGGSEVEKVTGFSKAADEHGFAVAYFQAESKHTCFNNGQWLGEDKDDIKMTRMVIDGLEKDLNIDKNRVYLAGFSWGGSMVHHAADDPQIADKIAAVAEVSGFMTGKEKAEGARHLSEISIHSTEDDTVFYKGRVSFGHKMVGLQQQTPPYTFDNYARRNGATGPAQVSDVTAPDGSVYQVKDVTNPVDGSEVKLVTLHNLKHVWPGGAEAPEAINATEMIVDFFSRHEKQEK
jgi:polyhydroxybutyrate depolymerase